MRNKNLIRVILIFIFIQSCSKNNDESQIKETQSYTLRDTKLDINILDNQNQDLLSSKTSNFFKKENIKVYHLIEGKKEIQVDSDGEPTGFLISSSDSPTLFRFFAPEKGENISNENDVYIIRSTAYIELSEIDIDTIISEVEVKFNSINLKKAWYNEESQDLKEMPIVIRKDIN